MVVFLGGCVLLALGYLVYGGWVERAVAPDPARTTPAIERADGLDYVAMPTWRIVLVQILNIAGLGPVFGPIMGALWGPQVFLWVVLGSILGGAVHDFLSGVMSVRNHGEGLPDLIGRYLGGTARHVSTAFILGLMVLVGAVFVKGPAMLIVQLLPADTVGGWFGPGLQASLASTWAGYSVWLWIVMIGIFGYYVLATLLPIDTIIGRIYPILAMALLVMVAGLSLAILRGQLPLPHFTLRNLHPDGLPTWPIIFITVSCGAVSGFHGTQSPLMARCIKNECSMRFVFYGAMIAEGFIALVWASAAQGFYNGPQALSAALASGGPGQIVHDVCMSTMGWFGGVLALLGVVVLPITSGDTAFRVGRLIAADYLGLNQKRIRNRYLIALPMFAVAITLNFIDFTVVWRYFGWANQTLAAVTLWAGTVFLARRGRMWFLAFFPAIFMTAVTTTYILVEDYGFGVPERTGTILGLVFAALAAAAFLVWKPKPEGTTIEV